MRSIITMETREKYEVKAVLTVGSQPVVIADAGEGKVSVCASGFAKRDLPVEDVEAFAKRLLEVAEASRRIPKEPGWYWWRDLLTQEWAVVKVYSLLGVGLVVRVRLDKLTQLIESAGGEWGPKIEEPC